MLGLIVLKHEALARLALDALPLDCPRDGVEYSVNQFVFGTVKNTEGSPKTTMARRSFTCAHSAETR